MHYSGRESRMKVCTEPLDYYNQLLKLIKESTSTITLSGLYFGGPIKNYKDENHCLIISKELINAAKRGVKVHLLLDANRGLRYESYRAVPDRITRNGKVDKYIRRHDRIINGPGRILSKILMLESDLKGRSKDSREIIFCKPRTKKLNALEYLIKRGDHNIKVSFCKLKPNYKFRFMNTLIPYFPRQILEMLSTFHVKLNVIDDNVIMTGANLGEDYFRKRKDRCISIDSNSLAQSLHQWAEYLVSSEGSNIERKGKIQNGNDLNKDRVKCTEIIINNDRLLNSLDLLKRRDTPQNEDERKWSRIHSNSYKAIVLPRLHHYSLHKNHRLSGILGIQVLEKAFDRYGLPSLIATAYFNPTSKFFNMMNKHYHAGGGSSLNGHNGTVDESSKTTDDGSPQRILKQKFFVTAAKESNSFNHGLKRGITESYERILRKSSPNFCNQWQILEWYKPGRSFHGKGLWWLNDTVDNKKCKAVTDIGSSNYTVRSCNRDLELNFLVKTRHPQEVRMLQREYKSILNDAKLPRWLTVADRFSIYNCFGQLSRSRWIRSFL